MALFSRRERPPAEIVEALGPDERVLSWADTGEGQVVVATPRGLWWPDTGEEELRLIPWQFIDKATWRDGWLAVTQADVVDDVLLVDRAPVTVRLEQPRDLPPTVRKRVEGNIVRNELLRVDGGAVRFVARKRPGNDGLAWWARLEPGTRDSDLVRAAVRARLETLRAG